MLKLSKEKNHCKSFIQQINDETESKYLIAVAQEKHFPEIKCKNVVNSDIILQWKLVKL